MHFLDLFPIFTNCFLESCLESTLHSCTAVFKKLIPWKLYRNVKKVSFPVFVNSCIWCWLTYHVLCWILNCAVILAQQIIKRQLKTGCILPAKVDWRETDATQWALSSIKKKSSSQLCSIPADRQSSYLVHIDSYLNLSILWPVLCLSPVTQKLIEKSVVCSFF